MNRRELVIGSIAVASLPSIALADNGVTDDELRAARNYLLPGIFVGIEDANDKNVEADIRIDFKARVLLVVAYHRKSKKSAGFALTRSAIETDIYKTQFGPALRKLLELSPFTDPSLQWPNTSVTA